jgi:sirohydrochlorin ferrochelatase
MKTALLLIAHGSRHEDANADLLHAVTALRGLPDCELVEAAYLELAEPDIDQAAQHCVAAGADRVILLPYFLSAGVHVTRDLQEASQRLAARHPAVRFSLAEPIGRHPLLLDILRQRAGEAHGEVPRANQAC